MKTARQKRAPQKRARVKRNWRKELTADERAELERLEARRAALTHQRMIVNAMTALIRNRACQRARYAAGERQQSRKGGSL